MARMQMTFVPSTSGTGHVPLESIPEDVKADVEEAYGVLRENEGRIHVVFDTETEANLWARQAASYAAQRPNGALKFRRSPTKGLPKNEIDFRVYADLEANGEAKAKTGETE
jgi:hypothetical protein